MADPSWRIRLRRPVRERLEAEADARGLEPSWLAGRLIAEGLDRLLPADQFRLTYDPDAPPPDDADL